ncbi:SGNH/GDSL hydrolase family protein [Paenibacillus sp. PAMC21692]|uniref:SGNH/GDSL hydrolase family protein n=1 Tax=Paenibacillus sp. PAMC21692 TaxID=2762320 RepID=UPI00164DF815|nr:SGNH/GDSL hydrolase family protein [Paenibacillus sp. PAMC21692]QNK57736.1 GDSL family lipase [Paenibacillus sp. PAMC21692]
MKIIPTEDWFAGTVSVERREDGVKPWRIPHTEYELFPPNGIDGQAGICAGVRLRFRTDSPTITLRFLPVDLVLRIDCVVNGELHGTVDLPEGTDAAEWANLPGGGKNIEIWLPQRGHMTITGLELEEGKSASPQPQDARPKWVTYGSSITVCGSAASPTQTWPAIAAKQLDLNLTCLGFSGNCALEPMVARMIRDLPADLITLCVGINVHGANTLSARTFLPAVIGLVQTIRERHPVTPIILVSPIFATDRETRPNLLGMTVEDYRNQVAEAADILQRHGDCYLTYRDGRDWFGEADAGLLPDGLHPDAEGYKLMGARFAERVLGDVPVAARNRQTTETTV